MPSLGFEPTISPDERPQTYVLDRAATGTGFFLFYICDIHQALSRMYHNTPEIQSSFM